jgi:hypothetical protein
MQSVASTIKKLPILYRSAFAGTEHIEMLLLNNNPIKVINRKKISSKFMSI